MQKKIVLLLMQMILILGIYGIGNASNLYDFVDGNGNSTVINPFTGSITANSYYDYRSSAGHPDHGYADNDSVYFWLYEQDSGALSLNVLFGDNGGDGKVLNSSFFTLSGLPNGWAWTLQDDNPDIGNNTDKTPTWSWNDSKTDGGIIGHLEDSLWNIDWKLDSLVEGGSKSLSWYVLSNDVAQVTATNFSLEIGETITFRSTPEPATMMLFGLGLLGLAGVSRRKK